VRRTVSRLFTLRKGERAISAKQKTLSKTKKPVEEHLHWYLISGLEALSNADKSVSPVPRVLVLSGNAERDCELLREGAEAEWEILVEVAATEIKHRYAMELELRVVREMATLVPALRQIREWLAACLTWLAAWLSSIVTTWTH